jgi:hypothetical protein
MKTGRLAAAAVLAGVALSACSSGERAMPDFQADEALKSEMAKVAGYRVFFGHQSVGGDIVRGLDDLKRLSGEQGLRIVRYRPGISLPATFFAESDVGTNQHPQSKFDHFSRLVDTDLAGKIDIALVKICYVDLGRGSDAGVDAVFRGYVEAVKTLEAAHPGLVVIPVTSPLRTRIDGLGPVDHLKVIIKRVLGRDDDNTQRNAFSARIREAFRDRPVFDLSAVESTYPDGSRETYGKDGSTEALVPDYTSDGGHLNELGRRRAARELIRVLAKVELPRPAATAAAGKARVGAAGG